MDKVSSDLGVSLRKINVEDDPELADEYGVMSIPTTVWFRDEEFVKFKAGPMNEPDLRALINSL